MKKIVYRSRHRRRCRAPALVRLVLVGMVTSAGLLASAEACPAAVLAAPSSLNAVIDNLIGVIRGLLVGLATLFLSVGGIRYILAGGDPGEVEAAKKTLKYAALGYGVAVLAEVLVGMLKQIAGTP